MVLALALTLTLVGSAFAASITITPNKPTGAENTDIKTTYVWYRLLDATISGNAVSYYVENTSANASKIAALNAVTVKVSGNDVAIFTHTTSADGARENYALNTTELGAVANDSDLAKAIATALQGIKASALATGNFSYNSTNGNAVAENLAAGYYLVESSLGTALVLDTLKDETIQTKNTYHTDEKTASLTHMNVGDIVTYTINVNIPETYTPGQIVTVHDTLDEKLAADLTTLAAKYNNGTEDVSVALTDGTKKETNELFAKNFTITEGMLGKTVVLTYEAELLSTAADDTGYVNEEFSEIPSYETKPKKVRVWTFDFELDKTFSGVADADAENYVATFKLEDSNNNRISFIIDTTGYVKADSNDTSNATLTDTLTVNGKDVINVRGLEAGTYTLTELTTADGYNLLTEAITVTITDTSDTDCATNEAKTPSHTVTYQIGSGTSTTGTVTVQNNSGTELPSTGGIGTTILYVAGIVLVLGAAAIIIARRKAEQN